MSKRSYQKSEKFLELAESIIPLGSQTFSKSRTQYPKGASPLFIDRGDGSKVWDIDGNLYTDFVNSLLAVSIGYNYSPINEAVIEQLSRGVTHTLPTKLEYEVSQLLVDIVPCADMVRFGKNGSDATSAAIRLARAFTGNDMVAMCGYHGWHDWYIGTTTKSLGVPDQVRELGVSFPYNDVPALERLVAAHKGKLAAIIMEPMNAAVPQQGYLEAIREIATESNIVLIFDEICTGARLAPGGAQELFGVTPDLCAMGKGLANGFPLSAVMGREDIMSMCKDIFFSGTFGGENLSLAAAKVVLTMVKSGAVTKQLEHQGSKIESGFNEIISDFDINDLVSLSGHPSWSFINFHQDTVEKTMLMKTLFLQEMFKRGILILGTHNVSYSHSDEDIQGLIDCYKEVFEIVKLRVRSNTVRDALEADPLKLLFKVR